MDYDNESFVPSDKYEKNRDRGAIEQVAIMLDSFHMIGEYHTQNPHLNVSVMFMEPPVMGKEEDKSDDDAMNNDK